MSWNYRLVKHIQEKDGETFSYYHIHRAFYSEDRTPTDGRPVEISDYPFVPTAKSESEMRVVLERMLKSLDKPTIVQGNKIKAKEIPQT
jgi:hypothetical protein